MLIRSQNGEVIVNMHNIHGLCITKGVGDDGRDAIIAHTGGPEYGILMGKYEKPGRCREVISDICEQYQKFLNFPGAEGNAVFQMPEE